MNDEQIETYVRQAAEEASRAPSHDLFRAFARALPTTVLNVLVNSGKKHRPYDPTEFSFGKNEHLLIGAAQVLSRMYGDAARSLRYPMVGTALGMEGYRGSFRSSRFTSRPIRSMRTNWKRAITHFFSCRWSPPAALSSSRTLIGSFQSLRERGGSARSAEDLRA